MTILYSLLARHCLVRVQLPYKRIYLIIRILFGERLEETCNHVVMGGLIVDRENPSSILFYGLKRRNKRGRRPKSGEFKLFETGVYEAN